MTKPLQQLAFGVMLPWLGCGYIWRHRRLWKWASAPVFVSVLLVALAVATMAGILGVSVASSTAVFQSLEGWQAGAGLATVGIVGMFLSVLAGVAFFLILAYGLVVLCGPFFELLAEATEDVEAHLLWTDWKPPAFSFTGLLRNLLLTAISGLVFVVLPTLIASVVTWLPVVGWIVGPAIMALFLGWQATGEYVATMKLWPLSDKWRFIRRYPYVFVGCGGLLLIINVVVPFVAMPFLVPCSVVGFSLTLLWLERSGCTLPHDRRFHVKTEKMKVL